MASQLRIAHGVFLERLPAHVFGPVWLTEQVAELAADLVSERRTLINNSFRATGALADVGRQRSNPVWRQNFCDAGKLVQLARALAAIRAMRRVSCYTGNAHRLEES